MVTLLVMRHAKSSWNTGVEDSLRPLNKRGRRQGNAAGQYLAEQHPAIDTVLCSPSTRTRQTWQLVQDAGIDGPVTYVDDINEAGVTNLIAAVRTLGDGETVLLIGHFPGAHDHVEYLAESDGSQAWEKLDDGFVTSSIATLTIPVPWGRVNEGCGRLTSFVAPGRE